MAHRVSLDSASLSTDERRAVDRLVALLQERLGDDLVAVWLYGSRARGEEPPAESDVDLMVVTRYGAKDSDIVDDAVWEAAEAEAANPFWFSAQIVTPEWLADRRRIESFFIREVDRDKIVLAGGP